MRSVTGWLKNRRGSVRAGLACALAALVLVPALLWADAPAWWTERGVLKPGAAADDYAAVNQGQVKNIAKQAYEEMKAKLPDGAGATLDAIWAMPAASTDDYRAINLGQLKNVAEPFYARLQELNYTGQPLASGQTRPWSGTSDNYALANIGQVKNLFSFDLSSISLDDDRNIILESGDLQTGPAGQVLPLALTVHVLNSQGLPVSGATVTFTITAGPGTLSASASGGSVTSLGVISGLTGQALVYLKVDGAAGALNGVKASLASQSVVFKEYVSGIVASMAGSATVPTEPSSGTAPAPGSVANVGVDAELPAFYPPSVWVTVAPDPSTSEPPYSDPDPTKVTVHWRDYNDDDNSPTGYVIERRVRLEPWEMIAQVGPSEGDNNGSGNLSWDDPASLLGAHHYQYRITAQLLGRNSAPSSPVDYIVPDFTISSKYSTADGYKLAVAMPEFISSGPVPKYYMQMAGSDSYSDSGSNYSYNENHDFVSTYAALISSSGYLGRTEYDYATGGYDYHSSSTDGDGHTTTYSSWGSGSSSFSFDGTNSTESNSGSWSDSDGNSGSWSPGWRWSAAWYGAGAFDDVNVTATTESYSGSTATWSVSLSNPYTTSQFIQDVHACYGDWVDQGARNASFSSSYYGYYGYYGYGYYGYYSNGTRYLNSTEDSYFISKWAYQLKTFSGYDGGAIKWMDLYTDDDDSVDPKPVAERTHLVNTHTWTPGGGSTYSTVTLDGGTRNKNGHFWIYPGPSFYPNSSVDPAEVDAGVIVGPGGSGDVYYFNLGGGIQGDSYTLSWNNQQGFKVYGYNNTTHEYEELTSPTAFDPAASNSPTYTGFYVQVDQYAVNQSSLTLTIKEITPTGGTLPVENTLKLTYANASQDFPVDEAAGARYRKIALNGVALPDGKPQTAEESDQQAEETFIDAMTLGLRHSTTDVYMSIAGSDFSLSARRNTNSEVWNQRYGLRPHERSDLPFGPGWTSNLSANIQLATGADKNIYANVTDENGSSYRFVRTCDANGIYGFVPFPTAKHEQASYLTSLRYDENDDLVFKRKFGTELVFRHAFNRDLEKDRVLPDGSRDSIEYYRLTKATDRCEQQLAYQYTSGVDTLVPERIYMTARPSQQIRISQNAAGHVAAVWDIKGFKTEYGYTTLRILGQQEQVLTSVTTPDGKVTRYTYDVVQEDDVNPARPADSLDPGVTYNHLDVASIEDPNGHIYSFTYGLDHDASGHGKYNFYRDYVNPNNSQYYVKTGQPRMVSRVDMPGGLGSASFKNESILKLAEGNQLTTDSQRVVRITDVAGHVRTYTWTDPHIVPVNSLPGVQNLSSIAIFREMQVKYYENASQLTAGQCLGSETFKFDENAGLALASVTDFSGNATTYAYTDVFTPDQPLATGVYGCYEDPTSQTNALGQTKHFAYGAKRIMKSSTDELGVKTQWTVDDFGRRTEEQIFPAGSTTAVQDTGFTYGNTAFPNFITKKTVKKLATATADPSWVTDLVTLYVPDANGRVAKEVVDMNENGTIEPSVDLVTAYTYDDNGNKETATDPRGNVTTFSYDKRNRLTHVTYADHHQKQLFYDDRGNKTEEIDENGVASFWQYDALNRVTNQIVDMDGSLKTLAATTNHVLADTVTLDRSVHIVTSTTYNALNAKETVTGPKLTKTASGGFRTTVTKFEYDALQRLKKKTDDYGPTSEHLNYVTSYEYEPTKNPGGSVFDSSGFKPTKVTDPRNYVTEITYDKLYRPTEEKVEYLPGVFATTKKGYEDGVNLTTVTAPPATVNGVLQSTGTVTKTIYDALRRPTSVTEGFGTALAATTTTDYTSTGLAWRTVADVARKPSDNTLITRTTTTDYDAAGRPVKVYAPAVVDALSTSTTPVTPVTETRYDAAGNVSYVINPLLQRTDYSYDNRNRRYEEKLPSVTDATTGQASRPTRTTAYDGVGNVVAVQDARGFITTTEYDHARRPKKVIAPPMTKLDGTVVNPTTETTYDKAGNVLTVTDANGHVTTNTYDALNRLKTTTQKPDTDSTHDIFVQNEYDEAGNRTAVIDGKSQRTEFTYDGLNRNRTVKDPANRLVTFTYDAVNKTARVDSETRRTEYVYDARHRLTDVTYIGRIADNRHYTYDLAGQLLSVTESGKGGKADVAYTYDALGRQLTEASGGKEHSYGYDLANNRVKVTYGGTGTVLVSGYDALNRLQTLSETPPLSSQLSTLSYPRVTTYGYDLNGNRVLQQLPNGEEVDTQYDALNRATAITTSKPSGALLLQLAQVYDPVGNLVKLTERHFGSTLAPRTVTNGYDNVNRLTNEVNVEGSTKTIATAYTFDPANNRTAKAVATTTGSSTALVETAYVYNSLNQLQTATTGTAITSYTYDLNGSRLTATLVSAPNAPPLTDTYSYDYENRLVSLAKNTSGGAGTYAYVYDYRTRRVLRSETQGGATTLTQSIFSGGVSVSEYSAADLSALNSQLSASAVAAEYIRGSDWGGGVGGLLYSVRSGTPSFKHYNSRGDVISETNATGASTWQGTYEAFGKRTQESGTTQDRQKANTKEEDPTGLLNEGFRYRDLETGAFITRDPLGFVDGPNMYAYVVQNPWSKFDPEGLFLGTPLSAGEWFGSLGSGLAEGGVDVAMAFRSAAEAPGAALGYMSVNGVGKTIMESHDQITTNLAQGYELAKDTSLSQLGRDAKEAGNLYVNDKEFRQGVTEGLAGLGTGIATGEALQPIQKALGAKLGEVLKLNEDAKLSSGTPPAPTAKPPVQRVPQSLQDQMTLEAAQDGAGQPIIKNLSDPNFKGMEKWEYKVKSTEGRDSVVHYVKDPATGELKDFKFKKSSTDAPTVREKTPEPKVSSGSGG